MKKKLKYITLNAYIQMGKEKMKMKDEGVVALQRFPWQWTIYKTFVHLLLLTSLFGSIFQTVGYCTAAFSRAN